MNANGVKSEVGKFFSECAQELWEKFSWILKVVLIALVAHVVLVFAFLALSAGWSESIGMTIKEFSNFMDSVFTYERMTKFDNAMHRVLAIALVGGSIWCLVLLAVGIVFAALAVALKIKEDRQSRKISRVLYVLCSFFVTYFIIVSQPVMAVVDKFARFMTH